MATGWFGTLRSAKVRAMGFRELLPHVTYMRYSDLKGDLETATLHMDNHFDWENGNYIAPGINIQWEGLDEPFEIYPGVIVPPGVLPKPSHGLPHEHRSPKAGLGPASTGTTAVSCRAVRTA